MSERTSTRASVNCSGLAKAGVPTNPCVKPIASGFSVSAFATPKSITFTTVSAFSALPRLESFASGAAATNIKFAGFKSRCTRPCVSAAASAGDLQGDVDGRESVKRPGAANTHLQRFAFHQFHRAEALAVLFADAEMVNGRDIWMPQRCGCPCFAHEPFACFRSAFRPFRVDKLQRNRPFERGVNRAIRHSHGAATEFPVRPVVASLDPVIPESIRYGGKRGFVRFFRVVESDAQQANHAATEIAGECSLQPSPAVRTDRYGGFLCQHQEKPF